MGSIVRVIGTKPPESTIRSGQCRGLHSTVVDRVVADFAPESRRLYLDPAPTPSWPTDVTYVATTADAEFSLDLQRGYAAELGTVPTTLSTGHLPMLQDPDGLAALIGDRPG